MLRRRYLLLLLGLASVAGLLHYWPGPSVIAVYEWKGVSLPDSPEDRLAHALLVMTEKGVERRDTTGRVVWSRALEPRYRYALEPVHDSTHVYVGEDDGVTALDALTGRVAWHRPGPNDRLCISGKLLVAISHGVSPHDHWLAAWSTATGMETFRIRLPDDFVTAWVQDIDGLILVQEWRNWHEPDALLIEHNGQVRHRLKLHVLDGRRFGDDRIVLTNCGLIRVGKTTWTLQANEDETPSISDGGGMRVLPEGDILAFWYNCISDSGVEIARLNPETGSVTWKHTCEGLGVFHSAYSHWAELETRATTARVTSHGSDGTFFEILDLESGRLLKRSAWQTATSRSRWLSWLPW
jgi:outer membrane protein assembly factor BamB